MMNVVLEDKGELKKWGMGLENELENCEFCKKPTEFWHLETNNPVCQECAKTQDSSKLTNWRAQK